MKRTKHIYKRFVSLFIGQTFFLTRKKLAMKTGFCSCREITAKPTAHRIAPWRSVRTLIPVTVQEAIDGGKYWPRAKDCINPGQTHYVGDSCPGGHEPAASEIQDREYHDRVFAAANEPVAPRPLRDPMDQDHSPQPQPEHERTL